MESLANRSRPAASRFQRTYRVEMGGRTVLISLGLALLTGLVVFYMGVLTGQGSRSAETPAPTEPSAQAPGGGPGEPGKLAFSENLLQDKPVVEDLWKTQQQTSQDTEHLLDRAQRELTVEEVPAVPLAKRQAAAPERTNPPAARAPAPQQAPKAAAAPAPAQAPANAAQSGQRYTVQVFSSKSRDSAVKLVSKLKGMGFAAYLNQFQDSNRNTWYRVRVGKTSKAEAERLQSSLQKRANLKSPQILEL